MKTKGKPDLSVFTSCISAWGGEGAVLTKIIHIKARWLFETLEKSHAEHINPNKYNK